MTLIDSTGTFDGTFTTSDGAEIAFTRRPSPAADAPRIVMIHSLALDRTVWDGVVARLDHTADMLTYDCRGHGRSARLPGAYTAEWFARDLAELLDHVGWREATIAGCSMGGCVALAFAALYPARARRLALIDTTASYGPGAAARFRERAEAARTGGMRGLADFQATRWFSDEFRHRHPEVLSRTMAIFVGNDFDCYASACDLLGAVDVRAHLRSFGMPAAVIVGEHDYATPVEMARQIHEGIAGSTLAILPLVRHLTPIEAPDEIAAQLRTLLMRPVISLEPGRDRREGPA